MKNFSFETIHFHYLYRKWIDFIQSIRSGQNWKHLWDIEMKVYIPSIFTLKDGIPTRFKICIINLVNNGYSLESIGKRFPRIKGDLKRIKDKLIW